MQGVRNGKQKLLAAFQRIAAMISNVTYCNHV